MKDGFTVRNLTYEDFGLMMKRMLSLLRDIQFTHVYAPPRGGLPAAVHISHHLNIPLVMCGEMLSNMNKWTSSDHLLVVDDIARHGKTLASLSQMLAIRKIRHVTATLFASTDSVIKPDFVVETTDEWILFPWQPEEEQAGYLKELRQDQKD